MICTWSLKVSILMALTFCTDFASTSLDECSITEREGLYYSPEASNSYGTLLKKFENKSKEECRNSCCELEQCNFMMYTTAVLRDHQRSTNTTCFLFNCTDMPKCKTRKLSANITGVSFIGIKRENLTEASNYTDPTIEQSHFKTEVLTVSTMSSLEAISSNVTHLNPSSSLQNNVQAPTSRTSQGNRKKFSEQQSHTTTVSLVISLIIGILLFGTVVFLIGRRWSEQCFRRGYSRVDYLLNDYD